MRTRLSPDETCWDKYESKDPFYCFGLRENPLTASESTWMGCNLVGCKALGYPVNINVLGAGGIYRYGNFINTSGDFRYDKKRILREIKIEEKKVTGCKLLDMPLVFNFIEAWPRIVNPKYQFGWKVWPNNDRKDRIREELRAMGLKINDPPPMPDYEEWPIITERTVFYDICKNAYKDRLNWKRNLGLSHALERVINEIDLFWK